MNTREVAKQIIAKADVVQDKLIGLKNDVEALLQFILAEVKATTGEIPDKDAFLDLVSHTVDEILTLPFLIETIDHIIIQRVLKVIDEAILSAWFGDDWFEKLQEKTEKL